MIDNYNLILLSGGRYHCDASWGKHVLGNDQCYKVYFPVSGRALLEFDADSCILEAGRSFLISGFRLTRQTCPKAMEVYWLHFVPESLYLRFLLDQLPPVCSSSILHSGWLEEDRQTICKIFKNPHSASNEPRQDRSPLLDCRINGLLLVLISRLLECSQDRPTPLFDAELCRLRPAIDYMQSHFRENPSLKEMAKRVGMAPNHFHRKFKQLLGRTPFDYMLSQRMDRARNLLGSTTLTIKEICVMVGYDDPAYFSRIFTGRMGATPSQYRSNHQWHGT